MKHEIHTICTLKALFEIILRSVVSQTLGKPGQEITA